MTNDSSKHTGYTAGRTSSNYIFHNSFMPLHSFHCEVTFFLLDVIGMIEYNIHMYGLCEE